MKKIISAAVSAVLLGTSVISPVCCAEENLYYSDAYSSSDGLGTVYFDTADFYANYSDGAYNYGTFLDENNVQVYMEMMKLVNPSVDTVTVTLPNPVTFTVSTPDPDLMTDEDILAYKTALFENCRPGIDSALFDIPELFWIDLNQMGVNIQNYDISYNMFKRNFTIEMSELTFNPAFYESYGSLETVNEYKQKLTEAVENFPVSGETRYDQLKSIHDYICKYTFYDIESPFTSSAVGAIVEPGAVCEAYSEGFKIICDSLGIPCVLIVGNFNSENDEAHMWNYVQMEDGLWYAVDLTWDDLDGDGGEVKHQYFLKGAESFSAYHTPQETIGFTTFNYPELAQNDYVPGTSDVTTTTTTSSTTTTTEEPTTTTTTSTTTTTKKTTTTTTSSTTTTTEEPTTTTTTSTTTTTKKTTTTTTSSTTTTTKKTTTTTTSSTTTTTEKTTTTTTVTTTGHQQGDVNRDGEVNIADLVYCAKTVLMTHKPVYSCDVDNDGTTDAFDVALLRMILVKLFF